MKQIKTLVLMQLKDKVDFSWVKNRKSRIHTIVSSIIKFVILTLIYTAVLYAAKLLGVIFPSDMPQLMTLIITLLMIMLLISCTYGLTKALYFSEDNRVLISLPVSNNKIFISKLLVFFFYELKRSFSFTIPIIFGCAINIYIAGNLSIFTFIWMIIPLMLIVSIPVLLGALLSIPTMFIARLVSKHLILKILLFIGLLCAYIYLFVSIIDLIPDTINLTLMWKDIRYSIIKFLSSFENNNQFIAWVTRTLIGEKSSSGVFYVNFQTVIKVLVVGLVCAVLYLASYLISRPIFFVMMSKNFEFNKDSHSKMKNKKHSSFIAFNIKEFKVSIRSIEISLNYIIVYTTIPLLILVINTIFGSIEKNLFGIFMSYAFNILLIVLPLLMSNSLIATLYSKEGRAGYIKKTKPVNPLLPLISKLTFNIVLSIPCVVVSILLFGNYVKECSLLYPEKLHVLGFGNSIMLIFAILFIHYAHLFYSATLDIMNPLNEMYATTGEDFSNENENKASVAAFVMAVFFALFAFIFFNEAMNTGGISKVCVKLLFIGGMFALYFISNYVLKIKAYYAQSKE